MGPKKKQEKMSLGTFLGDQSLGSWADEMETMPLPATSSSGYGGGERGAFSSRSAFGGGDRDFGDRGFPSREALPLPSKPPYTAHLGNLSFDVTAVDIEDFFAGCQVTNVRIVEDKLDRKPKGFGYVEYASLEGLKKALDLNGTQFQGRNVRISVAEPPKDRGETRELNDWTRKGPLPELPGAQQRRPSDRGGFGRGFDQRSDAGNERSTSRRGFTPIEGDNKTRDFSNWERKGPLSPTSPTADSGFSRQDSRPRRNEAQAPPFDRRDSPSWGEGRPAGDGARPPRREFSDRPPPVDRAPTAADMDNQWRSKMQPDAPPKSSAPTTPDISTPSSPLASAPVAPAAPTVRPRLNLQKRTISESPAADLTANQAVDSAGDAKASPFGAARPIDTTQREKEIAEKREAARLKKIEEDKAAADAKRAAEKAEEAEKPERSERPERPERPERSERPERPERSERPHRQERAPRGERVTSPTIQENGRSFNTKETNGKTEKEPTDRAPGMNYEILRRLTDHEGSEVPPEVENASADGNAIEDANGAIIGDKDTKPQEIVRDANAPADTDGQTTGEQMDDEGWSTVAKAPKKGRGGARAALAS